MTKVPAGVELRLARAKKLMRGEMLHLADVEKDFKDRFMGASPLDHFEILPQDDVNFRAYIFFKKHADITECETNGLSQAMRDVVHRKLEEYGRGKRDEITVDFEFDSYEEVVRNFEGNYFLRMRK